MQLEMYTNCAGFFTVLEESIESTVDESEMKKRENGEMFEMTVLFSCPDLQTMPDC